ncbi:MAG: efflux RND transporter periplasmic adaptor subunit [Bryobacteraceae bacterium]|jgi:HlyD family secretion protein
MQKKTVLFTVTAVCAVAGLGSWALLRNNSGLQYRTATVGHGDINVTISASGNPNAVVTVQVGAQVSGIVMALYADFNTKVTKGQLIARLDPASLQSKVDEAQGNLDAARATAANGQAGIQRAQAGIQAATASTAAAQANVIKAGVATQDAKIKGDRRVELAKEGVLSQEDVDTAEATFHTAAADQDAFTAQQRAAEDNGKVAQADLKVAGTQLTANQAQVKQFEAALRSAQIDLAYTYIKAPADGVVVSRNVDVGQTVAASLSAPTLFQIAQDLTKMQVDTNVSEADVGRVQVGQPATFTVDAYPGRTFTGAVTSIRKAPINVQNVITYDAVVGVSNADLKLFPGMTADVRILVDQRPNVLRVLNEALRYRPTTEAPAAGAGGQGAGKAAAPEQAVSVMDPNNKQRRVTITTGQSDGTYTEVTSGDLKDGDRVIVAELVNAGAPSSSAAGSQRGSKGTGF